ncbi:TadE/TadG family type IV pilus assembly protein [Micromonospora sp. WMMA1947]|uniref:TadE/TadG family type IV pilus assembly protein n=1 Tax=Micromonospora sp. WMMA1947 TaxID=3015163 RepID=UPI00248AC953|nr:TadE/TadG family type IV pilus assembly protein [Micromonospora sp. WMMA1947]WBC08893.1 TadE/TadG family type IV pilus assembly protein [Micromonospora sp. WMMA1947]
MKSRGIRGQRGSVSIEMAVVAPAILALFAGAVIGGRVNLARQALEASAYDAARTASLARTAGEANAQALAAANSTLDAQGLSCTGLNVTASTAGFGVPVGQPATVTATVTCTATFSDVALPGMPGTVPLSASFTSPLDTYRSRA